MIRRPMGAIVADRGGVATPYALHHLQPRDQFFLVPGIDVYEGMIIGEHNRANSTDVNCVREKKLSNIRNHGKDENILLASPRILTIETAMEWIDRDELVEVTPDTVRVRKKELAINKRERRRRDRRGPGGRVMENVRPSVRAAPGAELSSRNKELDGRERSLSALRGVTFLAAGASGSSRGLRSSVPLGGGGRRRLRRLRRCRRGAAVLITRKAEIEELRLALVARGLARIADTYGGFTDRGEKLAPEQRTRTRRIWICSASARSSSSS